MKQKTIQCLLTFVWLAIGQAGWAQDVYHPDQNAVLMEIADRYGDKKIVPLTDGVTLYWPQSRKSSGYELRPSFGVLTDKDGAPVYSFPIGYEDLSCIKFLNSPASYTSPDMSGYQAPAMSTLEWNNTYPLRFDIDGKSYWMAEPGELRFSSPIGTYELITADGQHYTIPMASTQLIHFQDSVQGIGGYLSRLAESSLIYYWSFFDGQSGSTNYLHEDFYAMIPDGTNHNISLLMPSDEALQYVPNIVSYVSRKPQAFKLTMWSGSFPFTTGRICYSYDFLTGEVANMFNTEQMSQWQLTTYLATLLRSHTILHNRPEDFANGLNSGNDYYLALDGSPVRVIREGGKVVGVQGAYHLWNQAHGRTAMSGGSSASLVRANITNQRTKGNGTIYCIDNTLEATPRTIYNVLSGEELAEGESNPYQRFFDLCSIPQLFTSKIGGLSQGLDFLTNIPFTLFVPTNEAIEQEAALHGLPLAEELEALQEQIYETEDDAVAQELQLTLQKKQARIAAFVKAHFQFGIEIADQLPFDREHHSMLVLEETLQAPKLRVQGLGNGRMTVTGEDGNTRHVVDAHKNMFVREVRCIRDQGGTGDGPSVSPVGLASLNNLVIQSYATGVIHQIDGVLRSY